MFVLHAYMDTIITLTINFVESTCKYIVNVGHNHDKTRFSFTL